MAFWLITPVKPFEEGKSRLAKVLSIAERTSLNQQLLTNLLTVVQRAGVCTGMIVVSQSRAALQLAAAHNAVPLLENKQKSYVDGLNPALEQARAAAMAQGADEAILVRPDGLVTEASHSNLFVERDGMLLTPPASLGLLPGVLRRSLIDEGRAKEAELTLEDLAQGFLLGNSVRGLMKAELLK